VAERVRDPAEAAGLNRFAAADDAAIQNAAPPTASWATMSSPAPTRWSTVAPNAAS
jgi:hypothetical protein